MGRILENRPIFYPDSDGFRPFLVLFEKEDKMVDDAELLWERVCALREEQGKSLAQIAEESRVPITSVKRFFSGETKNPGFLSLCQIIYALGGSVDEVLEIDREKQPVHMEADSKYSRFLEKDLRYERKSKFRVWVAFLVLVAINICMLLFDIFNPYVGYIRYQRQMAAYTGETASVVLCVVISKIKAATRV